MACRLAITRALSILILQRRVPFITRDSFASMSHITNPYHNHRPIIWLVLSGLFMLAGCSASGPSLSGKVTLDDKPIEMGSIALVPIKDTKGPSAGGQIAAGQYKIESSKSGLVAGTYQVQITASVPTGKKIEAGSPLPPGTMVDELVDLPKHYNTESTLECVIAPGANEKNFELTTASSK